MLGGATRYTEEQIVAGYEVGRHIAISKRNVVTGGTSGIPYAAAIGAQTEGGLVVGISPALSEEDHVNRFKKPADHIDMMVYTGMSLDGRSPLIIRSAGGSIFVGGEFGTLNEFTSAWMHGRSVIGVLEGLGGITDSIRNLLERSQTQFGSTVVFGSNPKDLVRSVCDLLESQNTEPDADSHICSDVRNVIDSYVQGDSK